MVSWKDLLPQSTQRKKEKFSMGSVLSVAKDRFVFANIPSRKDN